MPEVVLTFFWKSSGKFEEADEGRRVEFLIRPWWGPAAALPSFGGTARLGVATSDFGVSQLTEERSRLREIRPFGSRPEPSADAAEQSVRIGGASA